MCEVLFFSISSPSNLSYLFHSSAAALFPSLSFFPQMSGSWSFLLSYYAKLARVCVSVCVRARVCMTAWKADNLQTN